MRPLAAHLEKINRVARRPYRELPLLTVVRLIVAESNREAMAEFQGHRPVFRLNGGPTLLFVDFVGALGQTPLARRLTDGRTTVLDQGVDLTINKFANLPRNNQDGEEPFQDGPDCRRYLGSWMRGFSLWKQSNGCEGTLDEEAAAARSLQRRVVHHFCLSCLEARRGSNPTISRYGWHIDGHVIWVWMPVSIPGRQRRKWLEANVDDLDPANPGEQQRVQEIVNDRLGATKQISLGNGADVSTVHRSSNHPLAWSIEHEISVQGLARIIADEKALNLRQQRPAIQAIGKKRLHELILEIFEDLSSGQYDEKRLAKAFTISRATLSRFAGSRWKLTTGHPIPDLWRNTAQTLANHKWLKEAAQDAGVWPQVEEVLCAGQQIRSRKQSDE